VYTIQSSYSKSAPSKFISESKNKSVSTTVGKYIMGLPVLLSGGKKIQEIKAVHKNGTNYGQCRQFTEEIIATKSIQCV
jgi:hypothetical protein